MLQLRWQWYVLTLVCWIFTSCASPEECDIAQPADSTVGQVALALEDPVPCADGDHGACSDDNDCTVDMCLDGICRHGPVNDPNCCNSDEECDDGNPCTDDACMENQCLHADNGLANCCSDHADCGPGGLWDDQDPSTIDYCMSHQCVHTKDASCKCGDLYPCQADADPCTADVCVDGMCKYLQIPGCCQADSDCKDTDFGTFDYCLDGWCVFQQLPGYCSQDAVCDDGNPCNIDSCVNGYCRYTPNPALPDCCTGNLDCSDDSNCTLEHCDTLSMTCIRELVAPHEPKCCWTAEDCDDGDQYTVDTCFDHQCINMPGGPHCWLPFYPCNDHNPCTEDVCDEQSGNCSYPHIMDCCLKDADCSAGDLIDSNPCVEVGCDPNTNMCYFIPIDNCCTWDWDCWNENPCIESFCVAEVCKTSWIPGCCAGGWDCDDDNACTIDSCDTEENTCNHLVNLNDPLCCATPADCNDGDPSTLDLCVNHFCGNQMTPNCCWEPGCNVGCEDGNPCTCDFCGGGWCRNAPPGFGPDCCGIPLNCCNSDKDCVHPPSPLMLGSCVDNLCSYAMPASGIKPPLLESFNGCNATPEADWIVTAVGDEALASTHCVTQGALGPDSHYRIDATPTQSGHLEVYFSTPALDVWPGKPLTVQFEFGLDPALGQAGLYAHKKNSLFCATPGKTFVPLWQTSQEELTTDAASVEIPPDQMCAGLRLAFGISTDTPGYVHSLSIDSVRICHGLSPEFTAVPDDLTVQAGDMLDWKISAHDPDTNSPIIWVKTAPDFVEHESVQFSAETQTWNMLMSIVPKPNEKPGDYPVELQVSDGCLKQTHTFVVTVVAGD